jgi:hypothetical protein
MALPIRPRFSDFKKVTSIQGTQEVVGLNPNEANASDKNARFSLEDLRKFVLTGLPTSPGKWVTQPTVTVTVTEGKATVSVSSGVADFNGVTVNYSAATYPNITLPATGLQRLDAVAAKADGSYQYVSGSASQNPVTPAIATGALLANYLLFNEAGATTTKPTTTISVVDAVTDGDLNAVTSNAVFDALAALEVSGEYLPLENPTRTKVNFGDVAGNDYGTIDLDNRGLDISQYKDSGNASVYWQLDSAFTEMGTANELGTINNLKSWVTRATGTKPGVAGMFPFVAEDGKKGVRIYTYATDGTQKNTFDFREDGKIYVNGVQLATGGATTFTALTDTPSSYTAGKWLKVNALGTAIEQVDAPQAGASVSGTRTQSTATAPTSKLLDDELTAIRPTTYTTFSAVNTFNANKVMRLGGAGDTFNANHTISEAGSGNLIGTFLTLIVVGNGSNTVTIGSGWLNENGGTFDTASGKRNVIRMHYIDNTNKFYTITQPA